MSVFSIIRFRIKQTISGERSRGILKFLAPDIFIGLFLVISPDSTRVEYFSVRVAIVATGVALFTALAETRRFFFSGGDIERFYFVRPTVSSRIASISGMFVLIFLIVAAVFVPTLLLSPGGFRFIASGIPMMVASVCASTSIYFLLIFILALVPAGAANRALTFLQIFMALALLATFQLSARVDFLADPMVLILAALLLFFSLAILFVLLPFSERLVEKLGYESEGSIADLVGIVERIKKPLLIQSDEEKAGLMFFLSNLFRSSQFRLSTIGVAGTPVMVAVYWSMQRLPLMSFDPFRHYFAPNYIAPVASLVVSGIVVQYFLSQNVLSSRDHEAGWVFKVRRKFDSGKFVLGVRKGLLLFVHVPVTILVFVASLFTNPPAIAFAVAATYYFMVHVAASWFSVAQRRLPFSVPFTPLGAPETVNLVFMFVYSFLVTMALIFAYGSTGKLLMVNLLAFILIGVLEFSSVAIVNKRVNAGV